MAKRRITAIRNVRLANAQKLTDVLIGPDGAIKRLSPKLRTTGVVIDAKGALLLPSLIDPHLHLDLAYSLELVPENKSGTLIEAIRIWDAAKRKLTAANVRERAIRAIRAEVAFGTGHIRTHVDVGTGAGLRLAEGVLAARESCRDLCDIQICVFPQDGILRDPGAYDQMREAMRMGCDVVGGIAHNERTDEDSKRHIEMLFDLAEEFDAPIDCHIDETDDPNSRWTQCLAAETIKRNWQSRVTASHVCALASYDDAHARKVIDLIAEAQVHVVTNPPVNLHLQGRYDNYPKRRGLTRVRQLLAAGVNVAAGQDCIADPFYPLGTGQMLDVAHMLCHADHLMTPPQIEQSLHCVTYGAAKALGLKHYGTRVGCRADLVLLPVANISAAIRTRPIPTHVLKSGVQIA